MNSDTHPLITSTEARFRELGRELTKPFRARITELLRLLCAQFGPMSIQMGMGGWNLRSVCNMECVYEDNSCEVFVLNTGELCDWINSKRGSRGGSGYGWRPVLLNKEHEALLDELAELCEYLNENRDAGQFLQSFDVDGQSFKRAARK